MTDTLLEAMDKTWRMTEKDARALLTLAGFKVEKAKALVDGYSYPPDDPRFYEECPRCVWWFLKTDIGWIEIGWRKRVLAIDWSETPLRAVVTDDDVTKDECSVHAYSVSKALEYLEKLMLLRRAKEEPPLGYSDRDLVFEYYWNRSMDDDRND